MPPLGRHTPAVRCLPVPLLAEPHQCPVVRASPSAPHVIGPKPRCSVHPLARSRRPPRCTLPPYCRRPEATQPSTFRRQPCRPPRTVLRASRTGDAASHGRHTARRSQRNRPSCACARSVATTPACAATRPRSAYRDSPPLAPAPCFLALPVSVTLASSRLADAPPRRTAARLGITPRNRAYTRDMRRRQPCVLASRTRCATAGHAPSLCL